MADMQPRGYLGERRPLIRKKGNRLYERFKRNKRHRACGAILVSEMLERIAFLGLIISVAMFLNKDPLDWTSYNSIFVTFILIGCSYTFCIIGGPVADVYLGRTKTICLSYVVYIGGYIFFPILAQQILNDPDKLPAMCSHVKTFPHIPSIPVVVNGSSPPIRPTAYENCAWPVYAFVCIVAVGAGFVKTNIAPFGAEHWESDTQIHDDVVESFFDWFFWTANIGALLFLGVTVYIQQQVSFYYGYIIPSVLLSFGLAVFICGLRWYTQGTVSTTTRKAIKAVFGVLKYGLCRETKCCWRGSEYMDTAISSTHMPLGDIVRLRLPKTRFDRARIKYGGEYNDVEVDEAVAFLRLVVIMLAFIPYWTVYHQMPTSFVFQGLHMRLQPSQKNHSQLTSGDFAIPVGWLYMVESAVMIIFIPLMDFMVYPKLSSRGRSARGLRNRIAIGFFLASLSMVAAGVLEHMRLQVVWGNVKPGGFPNTYNQLISNTSYETADMTVFWQVPQYVVLGMADVFSSVAGLELAYSQAPQSMKGIVMSVYWFYAGIGGFFGAIFEVAFTGVWFFSWDYGNINCRIYCNNKSSEICYACHLDYYFFFLAGFALFGLLLFILLSVKVGIKSADDGREDEGSY